MADIKIDLYFISNIKGQLCELGYKLSNEDLKNVQDLVNAVIDLYFHNIISAKEQDKFRVKIMKFINKRKIII